MSSRRLQPVPAEQEGEPEGPSVASGPGNGRSDIERRLTALETHMQYLATKEDIQATQKDIEKLKVWVLQYTIGAMVLIVTITISILRFFF